MKYTHKNVEKISTKENLKLLVRSWRLEQKTIGFVPTMGALHEGHLSLVRQSKAENNLTVVSIFVNPLQFNNPSDLEKYPRSLEADLYMLENEGVDFVFSPSVSEFYDQPTSLSLEFGSVANRLEGEHRPGHFSGVGVVVARLFNLVCPTRGYFGSKDLQQVAVIKRLVQDLAFDLEVVRCPTYRESNGLAMSSRNRRLSEEGVALAANLSKALQIGLDESQKTNLAKAKALALNFLQKEKRIELEYLEWVNAETMEAVEDINDKTEIAFCIAAWVEGVRLIDNKIR